MAEWGIPRRRRSCLNGHSFLKSLRPGRPRRGEVRTLRCRVCRSVFTRYLTQSKAEPSTCSKRCRILAATASLTKTTPADVARAGALYAQGRSTTEIAALMGRGKSTIERLVARAGVPMRAHTSTQRCVVDECPEPAWKHYRNGKGYAFGTRCRPHELAHRAARRKPRRMSGRAA